MNIKNLAIIPVKENSIRVPKKNYIKFDNIPIFIRVYQTVYKTKCFDKFIISTDSEKIIKISKKFKIPTIFICFNYLKKKKTSVSDICYNIFKN